MSRRSFLITCEHAGNFVPANYRYLFLGNEAVLDTHRGIDIGAGALAENLAEHGGFGLEKSSLEPIWVDECDRSVNHSLSS